MEDGIVIVPYQRLDEQTLNTMLKEFISREATDYGEAEMSEEHKFDELMQMLRTEKLAIAFDTTSETFSLIDANKLPAV